MTPDECARFMRLRADLFTAIGVAYEATYHCKSYEGEFILRFPNYFETQSTEQPWVIELHCYLVGPVRHYRWTGNTFGDALGGAEKDIRAWIAEQEKES